jgi:type II secretory pathway component GspD/PulD (secretin)
MNLSVKNSKRKGMNRLDSVQKEDIGDDRIASCGDAAMTQKSESPKVCLRLNFRKAPIHSVLNYLHNATALPIEVERNVEIERTIQLWNDEPVNKEEAIKLLKEALNEEGYTAIRKGGMLAIIRRQDAKKHFIPLPRLSCSSFAG